MEIRPLSDKVAAKPLDPEESTIDEIRLPDYARERSNPAGSTIGELAASLLGAQTGEASRTGAVINEPTAVYTVSEQEVVAHASQALEPFDEAPDAHTLVLLNEALVELDDRLRRLVDGIAESASDYSLATQSLEWRR